MALAFPVEQPKPHEPLVEVTKDVNTRTISMPFSMALKLADHSEWTITSAGSAESHQSVGTDYEAIALANDRGTTEEAEFERLLEEASRRSFNLGSLLYPIFDSFKSVSSEESFRSAVTLGMFGMR